MVENSILPSQKRDNPKGAVAKSLDKGGQKVVRYPLNIEELDHWMVFKINSPVFGRKDDFAKKSSKALIYLPMPMNLGTQYSHSYNAEGLGLAGQKGADMGADFATGGIKSVVDGIAAGMTAAAPLLLPLPLLLLLFGFFSSDINFVLHFLQVLI